MSQNYKTIALSLVVFVVFMYFIQQSQSPRKKNEPWDYSKFVSQIQAGNIQKADIHPEDRLIVGTTKGGEEFTVIQPDDHDPDLTQLLLKQNVQVTAQAPQKQGVWTAIFLQFGPIFLLLGFFFFTMRQAQGGGGGALAFGKSRARLMTSGSQKITFADVAGVDEAKTELMEVVDFLKDPKKYQLLGGKIPKGVILLGPPGTGKTLLAKAVAGEAGVPFFSISGSDFVEMFVGVGAARVRDLFEQGKKNAPCIIFIDEIDAVGRQRGAGLGGGHDEREQTLNAMLVEMDGFNTNSGVILIAATNRMDVLDPALLRPGRFDRQVVVDRPDLGGREAILKVHSKIVKLAEGVDLAVIAKRTPGFSGADLANLINEAALLAARRNKKAVELSELEEAIDRVMAGPERRTRVITDAEKKIVAYHESGHTIVGKMIDKSHSVHKVSIIPRGHAALGATWYLPNEEKFLSSKTELLHSITSLLGGRSAEELVFGDVTTGAGNDLSRATEIAHAMICQYGMSTKLGSVTLGGKDDMVFIGRDLMKEKNYSERTAQAIDDEVKSIVESCHKEAMAILKKNRKFLKTLAEALLEREVLDAGEVDLILAGKKIAPLPPKAPIPPAAEPPAGTSPAPAGPRSPPDPRLPRPCKAGALDKPRIEKAVREILLALGENPDREGLRDTPKRVAKMYEEVFSGLETDPKDVVTIFETEGHEEMVILRDIPFYSMCEHHLLPFYGKAHVAYAPRKDRLAGLSKLARIVETISRRPQLQERITTQVADTIMKALKPYGALVIVEAEHLCMTMRGVKKPGARMTTSAVRGVFEKSVATRMEALQLIGK